MLNHGFKGVEVAASAWTAEALTLCMPAAVFSRSTECHNQDKVSLGTIATRDCLRILELAEQVAAVALFAATQAIDIRIRHGELPLSYLSVDVQNMFGAVQTSCPLLLEDRPIDHQLHALVDQIRQKKWQLYTTDGHLRHKI